MAFEFGPIQEQWLKSLEEHPERQTSFRLGTRYLDGSYKACCLGELGLIAGICEWSGSTLIVKESSRSSALLDGVYEQVGLRSSNGSPSNFNFKNLSVMNDQMDTWPEIAAHVRKNPEEYFTKSV